MDMPNRPGVFTDIPRWIVKSGMTSILLIAIAAAASGALWLFNFTASISMPLVIAFVIGIVVYPLVRIGDRLRLPRQLSSILVILFVGLIFFAAIQLTIMGIINEAGAIGAQLAQSVSDIGAWIGNTLQSFGMSDEAISSLTYSITNTIRDFTLGDIAGQAAGNASSIGQSLVSGIGSVTGALGGIASFILSLFIGTMLLYYLLSDYERVEAWIGSHLHMDPKIGVGIVEDATHAMRAYFTGMTINGAITSVATGIVLLIFQVPLVIPIVLVTFVTNYIPFFGALLAVVFAVLIAFGTKGFMVALLVLAGLLLIQNLIQPIVLARVLGTKLNIHPIVVLALTILGWVLGGLLGTTLAPPLAGMVLKVRRRLKASNVPTEDSA
ncbi:MAG: AI-2E family transporter [Coriobacteriia bacterium]|nr:AI-2E family transporter [Coriobacteriia bacterium]